ncbi:hypothetical protein SAMN05892883_2036 [Jatrophihabitans sp. GAS493]|uniref:hypothetical protein n=1 Tax=Jatrophihabitans sp. GAS493 TaxID=1907575 RepID=UPI000BB94EBF|nr:hypothetical protein [Jatrophihabitans sp. GAS493]SOD72681.1 hypothetical protein SAMN05892883_2036 [Jatrophihabitans sp. GAS493]
MSTRSALRIGILLVAALGLLLVGRVSAGDHPATSDKAGYQNGYTAGVKAGQLQGIQEGIQEGRASQVGSEVPASSRQPVADSFNRGYTAGENDAFTGYDGGWALGVPYIVTLKPGSAGITYRIDARQQLQPNVDYYLCPNGRDLCQLPHS